MSASPDDSKRTDTSSDEGCTRLPAAYDPHKYPHYDVQKAIYSMLLSALSLSEHFEKLPGYEERQKKLAVLAQDYLDLCERLQPAGMNT